MKDKAMIEDRAIIGRSNLIVAHDSTRANRMRINRIRLIALEYIRARARARRERVV